MKKDVYMKILRFIWNTVSTVLIVVLALIAVFNLVSFAKRKTTGDICPTVFGVGVAVVISGSMEPEILVDDLVIIVETNDYTLRDIVVYEGKNYPVTHRIVSMRTDEDGKVWVTTQGDANNTGDGEMPIERIRGEVVCILPGVGRIQAFLQSPLGMLTLTFAAVVIIGLIELSQMLRHRRYRRRR